MIFEQQDYRLFLKNVFAEKAKKRQGYTLRSFAETLQISNSFLSEVLNSKKSLSVELAFKIAIKLNLTDAESRYLCLLVQLEQEKDGSFREELLKRLTTLNPNKKPRDLSVDIFKIISDWHHLAILELTYLTGFTFTSSAVAEKLNISKVEAELAIDRLLRLELLEKNEDGKFFKTNDSLLSESLIPNEAFKQYHRQILEKAIESLKTQIPSQRISITDVLALDSKYLPAAKRLSEEFSNAIQGLSEKSKIKNSIYCLATHFFKISQNERKP